MVLFHSLTRRQMIKLIIGISVGCESDQGAAGGVRILEETVPRQSRGDNSVEEDNQKSEGGDTQHTD